MQIQQCVQKELKHNDPIQIILLHFAFLSS